MRKISMGVVLTLLVFTLCLTPAFAASANANDSSTYGFPIVDLAVAESEGFVATDYPYRMVTYWEDQSSYSYWFFEDLSDCYFHYRSAFKEYEIHFFSDNDNASYQYFQVKDGKNKPTSMSGNYSPIDMGVKTAAGSTSYHSVVACNFSIRNEDGNSLWRASDGWFRIFSDEPDPPADVGSLLSNVDSIFRAFIGFVSDICAVIVSNPLLLVFCVLPLVGLGVILFIRLIKIKH